MTSFEVYCASPDGTKSAFRPKHAQERFDRADVGRGAGDDHGAREQGHVRGNEADPMKKWRHTLFSEGDLADCLVERWQHFTTERETGLCRDSTTGGAIGGRAGPAPGKPSWGNVPKASVMCQRHTEPEIFKGVHMLTSSSGGHSTLTPRIAEREHARSPPHPPVPLYPPCRTRTPPPGVARWRHCLQNPGAEIQPP